MVLTGVLKIEFSQLRVGEYSDRLINNELNPDGIFRIYVYDLEIGQITQISHGNRMDVIAPGGQISIRRKDGAL